MKFIHIQVTSCLPLFVEFGGTRLESIPETLWSMALGLYPQYKRSKICRCLRLSGGQFKERLESDGHPFPSTGFVLASKEVAKETPIPSQKIQLTLHGQARSMTLCFDMHALAQVLRGGCLCYDDGGYP